MIVRHTSDLKSLIKNLNKELLSLNIRVKSQRLYEIFARSQCFKTDASLRAALPIYIETNISSHQLAISIKKYGITSDDSKEVSPEYLSEILKNTKPFPVVAPPSFHVKISIDWLTAAVSLPYLCHESNRNSSSWEEHYQNCKTYFLGGSLTEDEYNMLLQEITLLVAAVSEGYTYNGPEESASFTEGALESLENLNFVISELDCGFYQTEPYSISDFYGEEITWLGDVEGDELTVIKANDSFLFDHSFTDIQLRQLVATELDYDHHTMNDERMYNEFCELRDACRANFLQN